MLIIYVVLAFFGIISFSLGGFYFIGSDRSVTKAIISALYTGFGIGCFAILFCYWFIL